MNNSINLNEIEMAQQIDYINQVLKQMNLVRTCVVFPRLKTDGKPMSHSDNTLALLNHLGVTVRYNEMTRLEEINIPSINLHSDTEMNAKIEWLRDKAREAGLGVDDIEGHLILIANQNSYHPVRDWIDSCVWDGQSRFESVCNTLYSNHPMRNILLKKWFVSAVAALYEPRGWSSEGVLILHGEQGLGKTTWIESLVESRDWIKRGVQLDPSNKDSVLKVTSRWISELGEIGTTFKKRDIEELKNFITDCEDTVRPAYARKANNYQRRTVFFGSTNQRTILNDDQNRRFWIMDVDKVNVKHGIDVQQFWAEIKHMYQNGERWFLSPEERKQLDQAQQDFKSINMVEETLGSYVSKPESDREHLAESLTISDLLRKLSVNDNQSNLNQGSKWLRKNGFRSVRSCGVVKWKVLVAERN